MTASPHVARAQAPSSEATRLQHGRCELLLGSDVGVAEPLNGEPPAPWSARRGIAVLVVHGSGALSGCAPRALSWVCLVAHARTTSASTLGRTAHALDDARLQRRPVGCVSGLRRHKLSAVCSASKATQQPLELLLVGRLLSGHSHWYCDMDPSTLMAANLLKLIHPGELRVVVCGSVQQNPATQPRIGSETVRC
jgi:hypothetical protein